MPARDKAHLVPDLLPMVKGTPCGRSARLDVHSCLYHAILQEEDAQSLLAGCCCSQDSVW